MKKENTKKLKLNKIRIANLSEAVKATTRSVSPTTTIFITRGVLTACNLCD
jgi:hypothetical protein